jgi:HEAT repeats
MCGVLSIAACANDAEHAVSDSDASAPPGNGRRKRRFLIFWVVPLILLLAMGAFCWLILTPLVQVRGAIAEYKSSGEKKKACRLLGDREQAVAKLDLYLRCPNRLAADRPLAADLLGFLGEPAVPCLIRALSDRHESVRFFAACSLGEIGPRAHQAAVPLAKALSDADRDVRVAAVRALAQIGEGAKPAIPELTKALQDNDETVREYAVEALRAIKGQPYRVFW